MMDHTDSLRAEDDAVPERKVRLGRLVMLGTLLSCDREVPLQCGGSIESGIWFRCFRDMRSSGVFAAVMNTTFS